PKTERESSQPGGQNTTKKMPGILNSKVLFIAIPIITPALYVIWLNHSLSRKVQCTSKLESSPRSVPSCPEEVPADADVLVFHESASKAVASDQISGQPDLGALLTSYMRHNMLTFTRLPQGIAIRRMINSPADK